MYEDIHPPASVPHLFEHRDQLQSITPPAGGDDKRTRKDLIGSITAGASVFPAMCMVIGARKSGDGDIRPQEDSLSVRTAPGSGTTDTNLQGGAG
ncbi:hypothetical protein [Streptomyces sp. NPDC002588]|uniref:hypothetical protein n=1 Tax=Streptomyces sp. NPDC002588 TaxID=3154419 RepID=UPI003316E13E